MTIPDMWVEKYRPKTLDEYVWRDPAQRAKAEEWINSGVLPHLMLSGVSGTGKTSLAELLLRMLGIPSGDILKLNASRERKVEDIQSKIINFVSTWALGPTGVKYILLDEADSMSPLAQRLLRGEMENYSDVCRFIITCVTGDTKVYTNRGYKLASEVLVDDMLNTGTSGFRPNRMLRKSMAKTFVKIKTLHGFEISVTPEHRFLVGKDWQPASSMHIGDRINISVGSVVGKHHPACQDIRLFERDDLEAFLRSKRVMTKDFQRHVRSEKYFISPCYIEKIKDLPQNITIKTMAEAMSVSCVVARQIIGRAKHADVVKEVKKFEDTSILYSVDWIKLVDHIDAKWREISKIFKTVHEDYASFYYDGFERTTSLSFEEIMTCYDHIIENNETLNAPLGRLIGFIFGDGHLYNKGVHFAADADEVLYRVAADLRCIMPSLTDEQLKIKQNGLNDNARCIQFSNRPLSLLLEFLGAPVGNKLKQKLTMPWAFEKSDEFAMAFVQSLYDCEGNTPKMTNKDRLVSPLILRQNTTDFSATLHHEISKFLAKKGISSTVNISKPFVTKSPSRNPPLDQNMRVQSTLSICDQKSILMYFEQIGSYYEEKKCRGDLLGYLRYKQTVAGNDFLSFSQWGMAFDYDGGMIQDKIVECISEDGEVAVYDCCLDEVHSYVTDGFVSHNCNYPQKIIPAIHGRCQGFYFEALDRDDFITRVGEILAKEGVEFDFDDLFSHVSATYPDLRKCINNVQQSTRDGKLTPVSADIGDTKDYLVEMSLLFKAGKTLAARKLITEQAPTEEYPEIFRWLYQNLEMWGDTEDQRDDALLVIRRGLVNHSLVCDPEINLAACIVELSRLKSN